MASRDHSRLFFVHLQVRVVRVLVDVVFIRIGIIVGDETEPTHDDDLYLSLRYSREGRAFIFIVKEKILSQTRAFFCVVYIYIYIKVNTTQQQSMRSVLYSTLALRFILLTQYSVFYVLLL